MNVSSSLWNSWISKWSHYHFIGNFNYTQISELYRTMVVYSRADLVCWFPKAVPDFILCLWSQPPVSRILYLYSYPFRLCHNKQSKVYLPEPPFPHAEVSPEKQHWFVCQGWWDVTNLDFVRRNIKNSGLALDLYCLSWPSHQYEYAHCVSTACDSISAPECIQVSHCTRIVIKTVHILLMAWDLIYNS